MEFCYFENITDELNIPFITEAAQEGDRVFDEYGAELYLSVYCNGWHLQ